MKTTRTYLSGCIWCNATGQKFPMQHNGTDFSSLCPVCNGSKTVIVTETFDDGLDIDKFKELNQEVKQ